MPLTLESPRHLAAQLRHAITLELEEARLSLGHHPPDVHGGRRNLKRARALVRLGRAAWTSEIGSALNASLRTSAHRVGARRDAEALVEATRRLADHPESGCHDGLHLLAARLASLRDRPLHDRVVGSGDAVAALAAARQLLARHPPRGRGSDLFREGLGRIGQRGRSALDAARHSPGDPEVYHRLRRRAKDLRYALEFLRPLWPPVLDPWILELHVLTDHLGEANDLTLVLDHLEHHPESHRGLDLRAIQAASLDLQAARWDTALDRASRIWGVRRRPFVDEVTTWIHLWAGRT